MSPLTGYLGLGHATSRNLVSYIGSIEEVFSTSRKSLLRIPGIGQKIVDEITNKTSFSEADQIIEDCEKGSINLISFLDKDYPKALREVYDAPTLLFMKGDLQSLKKKSIAIVGTRKATQYGREMTRQITADLSQLDAAVVSGLAYGIDIEAHRSSLKNNTPNHAVLASGLNVIYPKDHWGTAQEITKNGCLISENPPYTKPDARLFPARNRIIAALAEVTIVVEAAEKGGALITANIADSYNKPVFAVPGNLSNPVSRGCNNLIKQQKALIYTGVNDLLYHLNWDGSLAKPATIDYDTFSFTREERAVLSSIQESSKGLAIDEISWKTQVSLTQLASLLLTLEFSGHIRSLPGKKYALNRVN